MTVPLLKPYLHTLSSCPGLQQCLHTGAALSQDGCLDTHADAHMHTRPLCRHTAPPRSVVLCYAPGRQNWGGSRAQMKRQFEADILLLFALNQLRVHYLSHMRCKVSLFAAICISSCETEENNQKGLAPPPTEQVRNERCSGINHCSCFFLSGM